MWKGGFIFIVLAIACAFNLTGCVSGELYVGTRRIDRVEQHQYMDDKSWYCAYVPCDDVKGVK